MEKEGWGEEKRKRGLKWEMKARGNMEWELTGQSEKEEKREEVGRGKGGDEEKRKRGTSEERIWIGEERRGKNRENCNEDGGREERCTEQDGGKAQKEGKNKFDSRQN